MYTHIFRKHIWIFLIAQVFLFSPCGYAKTFDAAVTGTVTTAYDDNVTYSHADRIGDFVSNLAAGLVLQQKGKTHELSLETDIIEEIFANNSNFNNTSEDLKFRFKEEFSKYDRLEIVDKFTHAEDPRNFEDAFGRATGRYSSYINQTGLSFTHDFNRRFSGEMHYDNAVNYYSRPDLSDAFLHQVGTKINYIHDSATSFNMTYDFIRRFFEGGSDATINSIAPGIRRYFTPQFYMDFSAGPDFINSFAGKNYVKPHYFTALTDELSENNRISLSFNKQDTTTAYTQDIFDSWRTAINFSSKISQRLKGAADIFYGAGHYDALDFSESLTGIKTQFDYELNKKTILGAGYSYTNSSSDNGGNDYHRNYVYLNTKIIF